VAEGRRDSAVWLATGLGAGFFPVAPGTLGSLEGLAVVLLLKVLPFGRLGHVTALVAVAAAVFATGVWSAGRAENFFGKKDPEPVVIDEVLGQMVTFAAQPVIPWPWLIAGFALFRLLDILKPFPADGAERLPGGWGIMTDDIVAGIYGLLALSLLRWVFS
jgi:phosphatidylglycerophosphatase A